MSVKLFTKSMDEDKDNYEIIENSDGTFKLSTSIPGKLRCVLNGQRKSRSRRRLIESNTKTTIKVPPEKSDGNVEVLGSSRSSVESAMQEITKMISQQKPRLTHFLSIPISNKDIIDKFIEFKNQVNLLNNAALPESLFQRTWKLHLTLGTLTLRGDEEKNSARKALEQCRDIIDRAKIRFNNPGDLRINIQGVNCMNDNPSHCKILYGKVESEILQTIANEIVGHFISKGFINSDHDQVKLHVTMMNVIFLQKIRKEKRMRTRTFDATSLIEQFSNYQFGEQKIEELHLSLFQTSGEVGYYKNDGKLNIS